jgi:hypothetical protein
MFRTKCQFLVRSYSWRGTYSGDNGKVSSDLHMQIETDGAIKVDIIISPDNTYTLAMQRVITLVACMLAPILRPPISTPYGYACSYT